MNAWYDFKPGKWQNEINVRDFILTNYKPYDGDDSFLTTATDKTLELNEKYLELAKIEHEKGVYAINTDRVSSLLTYDPAYLDKENEIIFGFQTDSPLKRGVNPFGGIRMARQSCEAYGYSLSEEVEAHFRYRTTHNDGVFRVYTPEMKKARKSGVITGLPDAYGRGRIIGDYRRVPLYGVDYLIKQKEQDKLSLGHRPMDEETIRTLEELFRQIDFLKQLKEMAAGYGFDISVPASTAKEAVQWLYFAYLGAIKEQNGAAMSLGRTSTFLDIYFERDLRSGLLSETQAQEIIDQFVLKLRMARQLRTPEYNELFAGDPLWITEAIGGITEEGNSLVTKNSYRFLHTLSNLSPAPEPNLTVLWSENLPSNFKNYCAKMSIETDSIQYENDDLMRARYGDDYGIACCVSAMRIGKQMQYFGARCNLAKVLLMSLNGGKDEISGEQIGPIMNPFPVGKVLNYDEVRERFLSMMDWLCDLYVNTMNIIHYMHDKYAYEKLQMALHDTAVERFMAFGIAGLSVVTDSLSAIKYAKVTPKVDARGVITDFEIEGTYPSFGNNDERVDLIASNLVEEFIKRLRKHPTYRNAIHTLSILTITSNVVYGKKTGSTPDGRKYGEPFAPGANPMHGRDQKGALASLLSVSKLDYDDCRDGISYTFTVTPETLGKSEPVRIQNLTALLDGYFSSAGHHINVNVLNRDLLIDAKNHPEKYPNLTIRVSGYAVRFNSLNEKQKDEVIARTFHEKL
ncbi:formate C-acetyltransferase [Mobilitalea sibirica]|uniref:Formate acetyltransferase n=1 Tax=Mobilitalea sibirica TaxID=1462919 RepID=A0A8J7H1L8_9FIRM|nr:formate C-acetyltransferase [Mobilitalea sibirica]MBH1940333.1 formate C-acetyltransferase [Mobilitalea sibirica]